MGNIRASTMLGRKYDGMFAACTLSANIVAPVALDSLVAQPRVGDCPMALTVT